MNIRIFSVEDQAYGAFNQGEIVENKPVGFPSEGGSLKAYSNIFYWANAIAKVDSTIGLHPHKGFEIMSFVLEGNIRHFDTNMNSWKDLEAGDIQVIRAGNGISHAEHMSEGSRMFQIWLDPNLNKTLEQEASYDDYQSSVFPVETNDAYEQKVLIGEKSPVRLDSPGIEVKRVKVFNSSYQINSRLEKTISIYVLHGEFTLAENTIRKDDFATIDNTESVQLTGEGELFVFITPLRLNYTTYAESIS